MSARAYPSRPVLCVDDEAHFLTAAKISLVGEGITNVMTCSDGREVLPLIAQHSFCVVALDITMPHVTGAELLPMIVRDFPDTSVVMITGINEVETAVATMKAGAFDYLVKPVRKEELVAAIRKAVEYAEIRCERRVLKEYVLQDALHAPDHFGAIITRNKAMHNLFQYAEAIAPTDLPIFILGETGVGKELLAQAIHRASGRSGEFVPVNIAGVADDLFSDTLFGHRKGAFTSADRDRRGLVEQAANGTLFLDEIGDLRPESQIKLLRLIQEHQYHPLGSDIAQPASARIIAATNRGDRDLGRSGSFRKDLYYRLEAHMMTLPPLRERKDDLPLLVDHFMQEASVSLAKRKPCYPKELLPLLRLHSFPGNIRELRGMIYDALGRHQGGVLSLESFRNRIGRSESEAKASPGLLPVVNEGSIHFQTDLPTIRQTGDALIREALRRAQGNKSLAAQMIGITRQTLNNRLKDLHAES